ncbi:hypothetical protein [Pseudarthrobacter sp. H2]|uniref:DNA polymerase III subunit beta family protein n=1 Tax=Pseudarthrobacter sp. H2 TaxID=3418415 RepID=UPI003CF8ED91
MLISKNHLRTRWTASKDNTRPVLTTIQLRTEGDEVVAAATDGYILSEVREHTPSAEDFPDLTEHVAVSEARALATTAAAVSSALKKNKYLPILNYALVDSGGITVTNLEQTQQFKDAPVEGNYPDYQELIPAADQAKAVVTINPAYLEKLLKVFKGESSMTLEIHGPLKPVVLRSGHSELTITGVVMPLKS